MTLVPSTPLRGRSRSRWPVDVYAGFAPMLAEFDRLLRPTAVTDQARGASQYSTDLYETKEGLVLEMAVPGFKSDQIEVSVEGRQLTVRGSMEEVVEEEANDRRYWLQGISRGEFLRTISVPVGVKVDEIAATVGDGILRVVMPKAPEAVARKIAVGQIEDN